MGDPSELRLELPLPDELRDFIFPLRGTVITVLPSERSCILPPGVTRTGECRRWRHTELGDGDISLDILPRGDRFSEGGNGQSEFSLLTTADKGPLTLNIVKQDKKNKHRIVM